MIGKYRKLKGRSAAELADRGRQKAAALAERAGISGDLGLPADDAFLALFKSTPFANASELFGWFRNKAPRFYPVFKDRTSVVDVFYSRFSAEKAGIVDQADRLLLGRFDLLGHAELKLGTPVPDWHFEPVSGKRSPLRHWSRIGETDPSETGDKKIVWELNRHQHFTVLGRAYWLTGDEKYADAFVSHVEDWIDKNPPKMGVNWMSSLEIAFRSISWIWGVCFFRDSSRLGPDTFLKILKSLYLNARHLERHLSRYTSPNTHLTGESLGLYTIGSFLAGFQGSSKWKETGYLTLMEAIEYQIRDDGGYAEQATQYHRYTADIYLSLLILRNAEGAEIEGRFEDKLRKLLESLAHVTQPNGETPLIGDDDGGRLHFLDDRSFTDFRSTLAVGAAILIEGRLKFVAGDATPEILWLMGPDGLNAFDAVESIPMEQNVKEFKDTGWYVIRDGWRPDSSFLVIDCGEHGFMNGGHAHADALSFVLSVKGMPVFVDSGTCTYTADPATRNYFRSSAAHNCLTVDGHSSSVSDGPFSWREMATSRVLEWETKGRRTVFRGTHDGYDRYGVKYEREVQFIENRQIVVRDSIETTCRHDFDISFILSPDVEAEVVGDTRVFVRTKDGKLDLLTIDTEVVETGPEGPRGWRIERARISPRYGREAETTKLVLSLTREHDFEVVNTCVFARSV